MVKNENAEFDDQALEANTARSSFAGIRLYMLIAALLVPLALLAGWFYFTREVEPTTLTIGSGPYRSDSYELMRDVADVVKRHSDSLIVKVVPTSDSSQNISLLNLEKVDLATIRSDTPVVNDVRMLANLFPDYFQIITRRDSRISKVNDLAKKRIAIPAFGTDEFRSFWIIGDHYDLPISSMDWRAMDFEDASEALLAGEVDALFTVRSLRDRLLINLFEDAELKRLKLDFLGVEQASSIALKRPFLQVGEVPKGAFVGSSPTPRQAETTPIVERILVTRENIDPDAIRELTRILFEHRLDLIIRFALASAITKPDMENGSGIPMHEGAEQYFNRDEPSFIQENAEPLALMVTVLTILISSLLALRSRLVSKQKNRMDSYNYVLLDMAEKADIATTTAEIKELKGQMFAILETVVKALDTDDVTEEGFQSFSLLWESVREILNDRIRELELVPSPLIESKTLKRRKKKPTKRGYAKNR